MMDFPPIYTLAAFYKFRYVMFAIVYLDILIFLWLMYCLEKYFIFRHMGVSLAFFFLISYFTASGKKFYKNWLMV